MQTPPLLAIDIANAVRHRGGRAQIVGGWVRDRMLGREAKDLDLEVFGIAPDALKMTLERSNGTPR